MSGTINSLGLGSGVLTSDLIDKLKTNDVAQLITPLDNKITLNAQKSQALDLLSSLLNSFKSNASALDDDTLYQNRSVSGNNDGVSVSTIAGSQIRDFSLDVTQIAKKNVLQSGSFTSNTEKIASANGKLNLNISGKNYTIDYTAATTLDDLKQAINDNAGSAVSASILQTSASAYSLVVTSKTTGEAQTISLTDLSGNLKNKNLANEGIVTGAFPLGEGDLIGKSLTSSGKLAVNLNGTAYNFTYNSSTTLKQMVDKINADTTLNTKLSASITSDFRMVLTPKDLTEGQAITLTDVPDVVGDGLVSAITTGTTSKNGAMKVVQDGQNASFKFDGISMSRTSNTITDIATGLTLNLLKDGGSANISITQDRNKVATEMENMVNSYNTLIKQLGDMTAYDATAGKVGIFNGDNTIKNISREITRLMTGQDSKGHSLPQYGISLDRNGVMSFDKSAFMIKINTDPDGTESFFSGKTSITSIGTTKTNSFASANTLISSGASGTMALSMGGTAYNFSYTNTTTLQQMADNINANTTLATKLSASVVQFGTNDYRMILTPKDQGVGESISITDSSGGGLLSALKTTTTTSDGIKTTDGVFTSLNTLLKGYSSSSSGLLYKLTTASKAETTSLNEERSKQNKLLEARYATLQAKFAAYDSMISKLNSQFSSLKQQIDAQANANK